MQELLSQKAYVAIVDRSPPHDSISSSPNVKFYQTDITVLAEVASAVGNTVEWASSTGAPLGGVINCAGVGTASKIIDAHGKPHDLELWDFTIAVNLTGSFNLTRLVLEHLVKVTPEEGSDGERGVVVLVASAAAVSGQPNNHVLLHMLILLLVVVRGSTRSDRLFCVKRSSTVYGTSHGP